MLALRQDISWLVAIPTFAFACFGMGLAYSPLALIVLREASAENQGSASSALSLTDTLGSALGTGLAGAIIAASIRASGQPVPGLAVAFTVSLAAGFGGLLLTRRLAHRPTAMPARQPAAAAPRT
jgi:MFS family permease